MLIVADNLQITNQKISDAIEQRHSRPIAELVRRCVAAGADAIDINPGPLKTTGEEKMRFLVETVRTVTDKPILLDTTNASAIEAGLIACKGKAIINGFSLEKEKRDLILPLAKAFDADIIGYLLYPNSHVPTDEGDCFSIAMELLGEVEKTGISKKRLIIDPVVAPLMWENGISHNHAVLSVIRSIDDVLGFRVRTIAGVSNLTAGPGPMKKKEIAERTFLPMLSAAGLDLALVNVFREETVRAARTCNVLMHQEIFSWETID